MARFLRQTLPRDRAGRYLEVGPGHGFLLLSAIEVGSFDEFLGVDLSAASSSRPARSSTTSTRTRRRGSS